MPWIMLASRTCALCHAATTAVTHREIGKDSPPYVLTASPNAERAQHRGSNSLGALGGLLRAWDVVFARHLKLHF